jgi:hypothetical protein
MRIWLYPERMSHLGVSVSEVTAAIRSQNAQFAPGKIGQPPTGKGQELVYTISAQGRLNDPRQFEQIIVRSDDKGSQVRLADIARVELGSRDYDFIGRVNGKEATLVGVFLLSFYGLAYSLFPWLVIDQLNIWQAASAPEALLVIFYGVVVVLPVIIGYTVFAYRVFWGKSTQLRY